MHITELKNDIAEMEAVVNNPSTLQDEKDLLAAPLKAAKEKLAAKTKTPAPKPKPADDNKKNRSDIYGHLKAKNPNLTKAALPKATKAYQHLRGEILTTAKAFASNEDMSDVVDMWLSKLPKGTVAAPPPKKEAPKTPPAKKPAKPATKVEKLTWKKAVSTDRFEKAELVEFDCNFRKEVLTARTEVVSSNIGEPGDILIFDQKGHPFTILTGDAAKKRCKRPLGPVVKRETYDQLKAEHEALRQKQSGMVTKEIYEKAKTKIAELETKPKAAAPTPPKPKPAAKPKSDDKKPKPKSSTKKVTKKRKSVCTLKEAEDGRRLMKAIKFFVGHAEDYVSGEKYDKITRVMRTKGDEGEVILGMRNLRGWGGFFSSEIFYRVCVDSGNLTKVAKPKNGSYTLIVQPDELKKIYTSKGEDRYKACLKIYRELLAARLKGKTGDAERIRWQKAHTECGDLIQKNEHLPRAANLFAKEVKKRRKSGEKWNDASKRVAEEIRVEAA